MGQRLDGIVAQLVHPWTVILAADESPGTTMRLRFESVGLTYTPEAAHDFRVKLLTTPQVPLEVAGVILHPDSLGLLTLGLTTADYLHRNGVLVGVKLDQGTEPYGTLGESVTTGLDGMAERLASYRVLYDVDFAKARSVFVIGDGRPTVGAVGSNIRYQIQFALTCLEVGVVPVLEPEILVKGNHTIQECANVTSLILAGLTDAILRAGINPEHLIVKTSLVTYGLGHPDYYTMTPELVAHMTLNAYDALPLNLGGIALLSGGHSSDRAIDFLAACNANRHTFTPITASFGRALQEAALRAHAARPDDTATVQTVFAHTLSQCAHARVPSRVLTR